MGRRRHRQIVPHCWPANRKCLKVGRSWCQKKKLWEGGGTVVPLGMSRPCRIAGQQIANVWRLDGPDRSGPGIARSDPRSVPYPEFGLRSRPIRNLCTPLKITIDNTSSVNFNACYLILYFYVQVRILRSICHKKYSNIWRYLLYCSDFFF